MSNSSYHGKLPSLGFASNETDASLIGKQIVNHRRQAVEADITTQSALHVGMNAVIDQDDRTNALLDILIHHKLLSEEDRPTVKAGDSRIKMAKAIFDYRHVLLDERILPYIEPGYSVQYQLVLLYKDLSSTEVAADKKEAEDA